MAVEAKVAVTRQTKAASTLKPWHIVTLQRTRENIMLPECETMLRLCSTQLSLAQIIVDEVTLQKKQHLFFQVHNSLVPYLQAC